MTEPIQLLREHMSAECSDAVILPPLATVTDVAVGFGDESLGEQALDDPLEIARIEHEQTVRVLRNCLHEAVAVKIPVGQRKQQLEVDGFERQKVAGIWRHCMVKGTIRATGPRVPSQGLARRCRSAGLPFDQDSKEMVMNITLWVLQVLLAAAFFAHGMMFLNPSPEIAVLMNESMPRWFQLFLGVAEVAAAVGLTLPGITRILPQLVPAAAAGIVIIMISATVLHIVRAEYSSAAITAVLLVMAAFTAYARWRTVPIRPRGVGSAASLA